MPGKSTEKVRAAEGTVGIFPAVFRVKFACFSVSQASKRDAKNNMTQQHMPPEMYAVLDSRALFDTDDAAVLEVCGEKRPNWHRLQRDHGNMNAVLVRWHGWNGTAYTETEVLGVIK